MQKIKYPLVNPKIVFREEDEDALLFDPDTGIIKVINQVGKFIWMLCDGRHSREEIIKDIEENFAEDIKKIEEDLDIFLEKLYKEGLITDSAK